MKHTYVIGWCDAYGVPYITKEFTDKRKIALIECMRKRKYNFGYADHQFLPYCTPLYNDEVICILTKQQWDGVLAEVYKDMPRAPRKLPMDIITTPIKGVLYEKEKYQPKEDADNV